MEFTPKTQEEIEIDRQKRLGVLEEGVYSFFIDKAEETISKRGRELGLLSPNQIVLHLAIETLDEMDSTITRVVRDYVGIESYDKLWSVCEHLGILDKYKSGKLTPDDFKGRSGKAKIIVRTDKTGKYPPSNWVESYVARSRTISPPPTPDMVQAEGFSSNKPSNLDDEIPF
jgi:hypothetical protein